MPFECRHCMSKNPYWSFYLPNGIANLVPRHTTVMFDVTAHPRGFNVTAQFLGSMLQPTLGPTSEPISSITWLSVSWFYTRPILQEDPFYKLSTLWACPVYRSLHFTVHPTPRVGLIYKLSHSTTWVILRFKSTHEAGHPTNRVTPWAGYPLTGTTWPFRSFF